MNVILVKYLKKRGKVGDIIVVKPGYARNYLLPQGIAVMATASNKKVIEEQKSHFESLYQIERDRACSLIGNFADKELIFIRQSAEDGRLFGSVTNKEIAKELSMISSNKISYSAVLLKIAIKAIGVYPVEVELHHGVVATVLVIVARSENEARDSLFAYRETENKKAMEEVVS